MLFWIYYGHFVYYMAIWQFSGDLVYFPQFWYIVSRKNLATLYQNSDFPFVRYKSFAPWLHALVMGPFTVLKVKDKLHLLICIIIFMLPTSIPPSCYGNVEKYNCQFANLLIEMHELGL
jgi:hypothetical protein